MRAVYACEFSGSAVRYLIDDATRVEGPPRRRLVFLPISWTGIAWDELAPITTDDGLEPALPRSVRTVPLSVACTAFVRIIAREKRASRLRRAMTEKLSSAIGYALFDMSYEGDYTEFLSNDQPLSESEKLEIAQAVTRINSWGFREDEEWIRDALIDIVMGR